MRLTTRIRLLLAPALMLGLTPGTALAVPGLRLSADPESVLPGETVVVSVTAEDVSALLLYQFSTSFAPTVFAADSVSEGPFLPSGGPTIFDGGVIDNEAGVIQFTLGALTDPETAGASGTGVLSSMRFTALGSGSGTFSLLEVVAADALANEIVLETSSVSVTVPEPEAAPLALAALVGMAMMGVGRRSAAWAGAIREHNLID